MYENILLPVDLGAESSWSKALPEAVAMAKMHEATLHVMTVVPTFGLPMVEQFFPPDYEKKVLESALGELQTFCDNKIGETVPFSVHLGHGTIYQEIIAAAERTGSDLIIMASHRPELDDFLLGPNAARVVRHAKQSVFVVRG